MKACISAAIVLIASVGTASAGIIEELRVGFAEHDVELTGDLSRESGINIQPQVVFKSPRFLSAIGSPKPYLMASINSDQETNFAGGGLLYKKYWSTTPWFLEVDGGIVYQDGRTELPPPNTPVERLRVTQTEVTFGSELQFHFVAGIGRQVDDNWDVQFFFEHLSHGQILGESEKNEGLENIGVKFGYRLND